MRTKTVKMTREQINSKTFVIVDLGLQVMDPSTLTWLSVTDESAVPIGNTIYCTHQWHCNLFKKVNADTPKRS